MRTWGLLSAWVSLSVAFYFHAGEREERCLIEDIPGDTLITGRDLDLATHSEWVPRGLTPASALTLFLSGPLPCTPSPRMGLRPGADRPEQRRGTGQCSQLSAQHRVNPATSWLAAWRRVPQFLQRDRAAFPEAGKGPVGPRPGHCLTASSPWQGEESSAPAHLAHTEGSDRPSGSPACSPLTERPKEGGLELESHSWG